MNNLQDPEESDDGYDSDLFENAEKAAEFKCAICTCICKDPIETEPCGHLYCSGCLQSHLNITSVSDLNEASANQEPSLCPSCRTIIKETSRSKFVERQVSKLRVKCAQFADGCEWKGELKYFKKHIRTQCNFVNVTCEFCKNTTYLRGKQEEHFKKCQEYPIQCELCNVKVPRKAFDAHQEKLCPNLLILCPNQCELKIKQSSLQSHIAKECGHRRVECLYNCYGCSIQPKYKDLKLHLSQHQVVHLELKVLYLERLAQSTELLSISNVTGIYPEISGLYQREQKPYLARPVWRNKNNKLYRVRYDDKLRGWVLDKKGFDGEIVALRYGQYPTAVAKHEEAEHILQLEQMLISDGKEDDKEKDQKSDDMDGTEMMISDDENKLNEDEDDEKKIQIVTDAMIKPQKREKKGVFADGLWHINGDVENSRIKVQGYTEREFDLEWEFKSLAAQMRRQRSGIQHVASIAMANNDNNNVNKENDINGKIIKEEIRRNYAIACVCGKGMVKKNKNPYNMTSLNKDTTSAICNVCENSILVDIEFYHCPAMSITAHIGGYDLCLSCGEARQQTQNLKTPSCDCGQKLVAIMSFNAYPYSMGVSCNVCGRGVDGAIWHCPKKKVKAHENGFDLCINCAKTYQPKKAGLMSWLTSRQ